MIQSRNSRSSKKKKVSDSASNASRGSARVTKTVTKKATKSSVTKGSVISVSRMSSGSNKGKKQHQQSSKSKIKTSGKSLKGTGSKGVDVSDLYSASKGQMSSLLSSSRSKASHTSS